MPFLGRILGRLASGAPAAGQHHWRQPHTPGLLYRRSAVCERWLHLRFPDRFVVNGSQQQFLVRDSSIGGWSNGVWNQVFSGVLGAPAQNFPPTASNNNPYTTLATSPVTREKPFLDVDSFDHYHVFIPALRTNSSGTTWANGLPPARPYRSRGSSSPNRRTPRRRSTTPWPAAST